MCKMLPYWRSQVRNLLPAKVRVEFVAPGNRLPLLCGLRAIVYEQGFCHVRTQRIAVAGFLVIRKRNVQDALNVSKWKEAILEETNLHERNETWEMVETNMWKKIVGCKWVFTIKFKSEGSLKRCKACLVSKGLTQTYGIDYLETLAPVAKLNSIRVFLTIATNLDWPFQQLDVKNAFDQIKEVYVDPPWVLKKVWN